MPSPIGYDGALTCAIFVTDFDRSIKWYQDVLGFHLLYRIDDMRWAELATEVDRVNVGLGEDPAFKAGKGIKLTFGVKDIEHARATLEKAGVRFDGPTQTYPGMVSLATFFDPDGNALMFFQDLAQGGGH